MLSWYIIEFYTPIMNATKCKSSNGPWYHTDLLDAGDLGDVTRGFWWVCLWGLFLRAQWWGQCRVKARSQPHVVFIFSRAIVRRDRRGDVRIVRRNNWRDIRVVGGHWRGGLGGILLLRWQKEDYLLGLLIREQCLALPGKVEQVKSPIMKANRTTFLSRCMCFDQFDYFWFYISFWWTVHLFLKMSKLTSVQYRVTLNKLQSKWKYTKTHKTK